MKTQYSLGLAVVGLLALSLFLSADRVQPSPVTATPAAIQGVADEFSYSACNCVPPSNGSWGNSSGDLDGFVWDATTGSWRWNERGGNGGQLYCPISYDFRFTSSSPGPIEFRVDVIDNHSDDVVLVEVFGQTSQGNPQVLGRVSSRQGDTGVRSELIVTVNPNNVPNFADVRYIWLRVDVPEVGEGQSGLIGYRVNRIGF